MPSVPKHRQALLLADLAKWLGEIRVSALLDAIAVAIVRSCPRNMLPTINMVRDAADQAAFIEKRETPLFSNHKFL